MKSEKRAVFQGGVTMRTFNFILAAVTLLLLAGLLYVSTETYSAYRDFRDAANDNIAGQQSAFDMQNSSDYLTEQARLFVESGDKLHLDNYINEVEVTRRRDLALETLGGIFSESEVYASLETALNESVSLEQIEYYALRLAFVAYGYHVDRAPARIRNTVISASDEKLSDSEKIARAKTLLYDAVYRSKKETISRNTTKCLNNLVNIIKEEQEDTAARLSAIANVQELLVILLVLIVLLIVLLTSLLIIRPLNKAIPHILADKPIPVSGAAEYRFLAETYNRMYADNLSRKEKLAFEATHDQLTGVYNRNGFQKLLEETDLGSAALLCLDVDHFKHINDEFGHDIGDRVLTRVTETVSKCFREGDTLSRVGGDEFVLILHGVDGSERPLIARNVKNVNLILQLPEGDIPAATISVGVAYGSGESGDELMKKADEALYEVKRNGRNGCAFYDNEKIVMEDAK